MPTEHRASSQDENNSADRKNLPSFIVSPLLPLPPSLFATRYDDHDNKMCGEGGCGCSLLLQRRRRHPALTIIETAPWFPEEKMLSLLKLSTSKDMEKRDQKRLQPRANCSPLSSHAMRVIVIATVVAPSSRARNWKLIVAAHGRIPSYHHLLGWRCSMKSCRQFRNLRLMNRARLSLPPLPSRRIFLRE